jgi:GNAT superfamily N-acetyltransferase
LVSTSDDVPVIRRVTLDDLDVYRDVRLRALQDTPAAFASTYEAEAARSREDWADRLALAAGGTDRVSFLAFDGDVCVGLVGGAEDDLGADRQLVSMWVAPTHRGTDVATDLVDAVLGWVAEQGGRRVGLWVTRGNGRARRFYERMGFVATGEVQPLPSDPTKEEIRMVRDIAESG